MELFELSKHFTGDERYALTDQIRRSSRSVCANMAEAWRRRRYRAAFVSKLNEVEAKIAETQSWLDFAGACGYVNESVAQRLDLEYEGTLKTIVNMILHADEWCLPAKSKHL